MKGSTNLPWIARLGRATRISANPAFVVPLVASLVMLLAVAAFWVSIKDNQEQLLHGETDAVGLRIATRLEDHISTRLNAGRHLGGDLLSGEIAGQAQFEAEAESFHVLFPDFQAINWVDPQGVVRWVTPLQGNEGAVGLDLRALPPPNAVVAEAERTGRLQTTPPLDLAQGGHGFAANIPVIDKGTTRGFVNLVFRIDPLIAGALPDGTNRDYHLTISDGADKVFSSGIALHPGWHPHHWAIQVGSRNWSLSVAPTPALIAARATWTDEVVLAVGAFLALSLGYLLRASMIHQARLSRSETRFRDFAGASADWFWELDENCRFSYFSERFTEVTDVPTESLLGKTPKEAGNPGIEDALWTQHLSDLEAHRPFRRVGYQRKDRDGDTIFLAISGTPHFDARGRFCGYRCTGSDITERKRAEEAMQLAMTEAKSAYRTKSQFLANMSHELRTPLNSIIGFSEVIKDERLGPLGSPTYANCARDIHDSGQHLLALINDILHWSKVETGKDELFEETIDVPEVARAAVSSVRVLAQKAGLNLELEIADDLPQLHADARRVRQILLNLLSNAIKFTPSGGEVVLKVWANVETGCVLQVVDTGIGIAVKDIPKAMTPFLQIDSSISRQHEGTGLGLSLTKSLIEMHGGYLDLQSKVGVGTTVTVRFPAGRIAIPNFDNKDP